MPERAAGGLLMKILCAWCGKVMGGRGAALSHGICRHCFQEYFQEHFEFFHTVPMNTTLPRRVRPTAHPAQEVEDPWKLQPGLFERRAR